MLAKNGKQLTDFLVQQKGRVLITGFSGAGKTFAKHLLEDLGQEVEDIDSVSTHFEPHIGKRKGKPQWLCAPDLITSERFLCGTCSNIGFVIEQWKPNVIVMQRLEHSLFVEVMEKKAEKETLPSEWKASFLERAKWSRSRYEREFETKVRKMRAFGLPFGANLVTIVLNRFEDVPLTGWFVRNGANPEPTRVWINSESGSASFCDTGYNTAAELSAMSGRLRKVFISGGGGRVFGALQTALLMHTKQCDLLIYYPMSAGALYAMLKQCESVGLYGAHGFSGGYRQNNKFWHETLRPELFRLQSLYNLWHPGRLDNYVLIMDTFIGAITEHQVRKPADIWVYRDINGAINSEDLYAEIEGKIRSLREEQDGVEVE